MLTDTIQHGRYFDAVDVCKYRPDWMETRLSGDLPYPGSTHLKIAKITVFNHTEVELGLFQSGARLVANTWRQSYHLYILSSEYIAYI